MEKPPGDLIRRERGHYGLHDLEVMETLGELLLIPRSMHPGATAFNSDSNSLVKLSLSLSPFWPLKVCSIRAGAPFRNWNFWKSTIGASRG